MRVDGTQVEVTLHRIYNSVECPRRQGQTKGKVLKDKYPAIQDESQVAVESPSNGHVEEGILHI